LPIILRIKPSFANVGRSVKRWASPLKVSIYPVPSLKEALTVKSVAFVRYITEPPEVAVRPDTALSVEARSFALDVKFVVAVSV